MITSFIAEHRLLMLLGIGSLFTFIWGYIFRKRMQTNVVIVLLLALADTIFGVFCVKTFAIIEGFGDPSVVGSMSLFGVVFFMPAGFGIESIITKIKLADIFDIYTPCMIFMLLCARLNCIFGGCCLGKHISGTSGFRWPTRECEIMFDIALLIIFGRKNFKNESDGKIYPIYMICYGIFRAIIEFFRVSGKYPGILHLAHIWALISLTIGFSIYIEIQKRNSKTIAKRKVRR